VETATPSAVDEQAAAAEAAMVAAGVDPTTPVQVDYFGFEETEVVLLPDGVSYVEIKILTEGDRRKYLNSVNREVRLQKASGDAIMNLSTGEERHALLSAAICGWNLKRGGQPVPFSPTNLKDFLTKANPKVIDEIEAQVRKSNPWLTADVSVEDIDQQIRELEELREQKVKEAEGKDS
jgi:hypothetical protein